MSIKSTIFKAAADFFDRFATNGTERESVMDAGSILNRRDRRVLRAKLEGRNAPCPCGRTVRRGGRTIAAKRKYCCDNHHGVAQCAMGRP